MELEEEILELKNLLSKIDTILKSRTEFENEYYDFINIKKMLFYILDNYESLQSKDLQGFFEITDSFHRIIKEKIASLIDPSLKEQYHADYVVFLGELNLLEAKFFKKLYEESSDYAELVETLSKM